MTQTNTNYDSEICGSLPLHLINLIQPYGILLVLSKDFKIVQVSENVEAFTKIAPAQMVSKQLSDFLPDDQYREVRQKFALGFEGKIPMRLTIEINDEACDFLSLIHEKQDYFLFEMEPVDNNAGQALFADIYNELKYAMSAINFAKTTSDICNAAVKELKRLSGFDKIMLYRFDDYWNGEVIAEICEEDMDSYLGLHFPASDIPKQARALYLKNPYRLIPTCNYTPVKIYPVINPVTGSFLDLSDCNLRSVPAVHIEYLKNIGVAASMSTAIIKDGQLWGLISCHHKTDKYLNYEMCSVFELMAGVISSRVNVIDNKEQSAINNQLQQIQAKLMEQVYLDDDPVTALFDYDVDILQLLDCEGAVMLYNRQMRVKGVVPERYEIKNLVLWLQSQQIDKVYSITNLSEVFDNAAAYSTIGSGIIVLPIHAEKGQYIIGFRPEVIKNVDWGGNPNEALNFDKNNITYHPRNSFKLWRQKVTSTSVSWQKKQLEIAESFRNFLIEYTLKKIYSLM